MVKIIEIPDIHFDPQWADITEDVVKSVCQTAVEQKVDFIVAPGDLFDHPLYATEKGGLNTIRKLVKRMLKICPVVVVEGTPSHDGPGCYGSLEDLGLVLLRPGKVYGYYQVQDRVHEITETSSDKPDAILFGIPELNTQNIQAVVPLPADQANAEAIVQFRHYVNEFIAPRRLKYADVPAFGLLHGNVSDSKRENEIDVILKAADILIHTEDLEPAQLTRWSLGHIHNPWESKVISAGYAGFTGISSNPWGNRNFLPAMNLVTVEDTGMKRAMETIQPVAEAVGVTDDERQAVLLSVTPRPRLERIPYGTPERRKIAIVPGPLHDSTVYDPAIAYWLHSENPEAQLVEGMHPWSRVTFDEQRKETRRITTEQAATIRTLRDMFKLADPDVTDSALDKVDTIEEAVPAVMGPAVDVSVDYVQVRGCILFNGKTLTFDKSVLPMGVTTLLGGNGEGKSSALAFMTPYPVIVGKHPLSGRTSAIKDFFDSPESLVEKHLTVNGTPHTHVITVRGAHTQSPKVECSLAINGVAQLERGSFDEMMTLCESLYGPFNDYLLTIFYVQPLQGKTGSSLMSATMTDIRDLVQSIGGIDREQEKRFSLDKLQETVETITEKSNWITTATDFLVDVDVLRTEIADLKIERVHKVGVLSAIETRGFDLKAQVEADRKAKADNDALRLEINRQKKERETKLSQVEEAERSIRASETSRGRSANSQTTIDRYTERSGRLADLQKEYNEALAANQALLAQYQGDYEKAVAVDGKKKLAATVIQALAEPADAVYHDTCPNCNVALPWAEDEIVQRKANADRRAELTTEYEALPDPEWPVKLIEFEFDTTLRDQVEAEVDEIDVEAARQIVKEGAEAEGVIKSAREQLAVLRADLETIAETLKETEPRYVMADLEEVLHEAEKAKEAVGREYVDCKSEISGLESRLEQKTVAIDSAVESAAKIEDTQRALELLKIDQADWGYVARMLQPAKIPAIELELVLDSIDAEATRIIEPFGEGRFAFTTQTQREGKVGAVDKFDIRIHDGAIGRDKSFLQYSPGVKAFFNDAYVKALVRQRNERAQRAYSPVIMDEADGPIQPERVGAFYEMQDLYWTEATVLVVSHNSASHENIVNTITMEDVLS